ncbi:MAG: hypothetical protein NXI31_01575 [bacterium]|nr:hypothetical protein [bacterium]
MTSTPHTINWPDLAIDLYDRLTGRNAEITYEMTTFASLCQVAMAATQNTRTG